MSMDKRAEGREAQIKHTEEHDFKTTARRNKLLGLWAAEQMGLSGDEATAYAMSVVEADFEEVGDEDVYRKVFNDLNEKSLDVSEHIVRRQMENFFEQASKELHEGV